MYAPSADGTRTDIDEKKSGLKSSYLHEEENVKNGNDVRAYVPDTK
jgi:hypothetical protein